MVVRGDVVSRGRRGVIKKVERSNAAAAAASSPALEHVLLRLEVLPITTNIYLHQLFKLQSFNEEHRDF